MARVWDDMLSERDRAVYREAGFGARGGGGERPALLIIDVTYEFVGDRPEPIMDSVKRFPNSCGEEGWRGMEAIRDLQEVCRDQGLPIFFTKGMDERSPLTRGAWGWKKAVTTEERAKEINPIANQIPDLIAPSEGEVVIQKTKPSGFFGSPLASYLIGLGVDTVLVTGTTTSGCVRATVIDAFSHNFRVLVVEDGTFDRGEASHKINLFDMQQKYGDVISLDEARDYLRSLRPVAAAAR